MSLYVGQRTDQVRPVRLECRQVSSFLDTRLTAALCGKRPPMNQVRSFFRSPLGFILAFLTVVVAGCGGSLDPVLGTPGASLVATNPPSDTTRPTVLVTVPVQGASDVPTNRKITAAFSEDMSPATISTASFAVSNTTLGVPVAGTVTYSVPSRMATFTPSALLASNSLFTATVTSAATDLAGNGLAGTAAALPNASNHVWTFTSGALADTVVPTVTGTSPAAGATGICLTKTVAATFSEPMDPASISAASFTVTDNGVAVAGSVTYDVASLQARFVVTNAAGFAAGNPFQATIRSGSAGVLDLAGNPLATDWVWSFTTGTQPCDGAVNLGTSALFGAFGGAAGVTNQGVNTVVNGHLGTTAACTLITGFHDARNVYTQTPLNIGAVNGSIYCGPPAPGTTTTAEIAATARADAQAAYDELAAKPAGSDPGAGQLGPGACSCHLHFCRRHLRRHARRPHPRCSG